MQKRTQKKIITAIQNAVCQHYAIEPQTILIQSQKGHALGDTIKKTRGAIVFYAEQFSVEKRQLTNHFNIVGNKSLDLYNDCFLQHSTPDQRNAIFEIVWSQLKKVLAELSQTNK